jgi:hypothetical protein
LADASPTRGLADECLPLSRYPVAVTDAPAELWPYLIVGHEDAVDPETLNLHPLNAKVHPKSEGDPLADLLGKGWLGNILVNTPCRHVINGNRRLKLARLHRQPVPVDYVCIPKEDEAGVLATYDPVAALSRIDRVKMAGRPGRGRVAARCAAGPRKHRTSKQCGRSRGHERQFPRRPRSDRGRPPAVARAIAAN